MHYQGFLILQACISDIVIDTLGILTFLQINLELSIEF